MTSTPIQAVDEITVAFPAAEVWPVLADFGAYPRWWPRSLGIRVLATAPALAGTEVEVRPFGGRPFRCRVETAEPHRYIRMRYFGDFIDGSGEWHLVPYGPGTRVSYRLDVVASGRLVRLIGMLVDLAGLHSRSMRSVLARIEPELASRRSAATDGR